MLCFNWIFLGNLFFFHVFLAQILQYLLHAYIQKNKLEIQQSLRYSHVLHISLKFTQFVKPLLRMLNDQNILQQLCLWFYLPLFTIIRKILNNRPQQKLQVLHPIPISHFYALFFCEWKRHCEYHIKLLSIQS